MRLNKRFLIAGVVYAAVLVAIVAVYGLSLETVELAAFSAILLYVSLTDIDSLTVPNGCIVAAIAVRAAYLLIALALGRVSLADCGYYLASSVAIGAVLIAMVLFADKLFGRESMGGGDLKLYAVAGFYFGWQQGIFVIVLSCLLGVAGSALLRRPEGNAPSSVLHRVFPLAPAIAASCAVAMLAGGPIVAWVFGAV